MKSLSSESFWSLFKWYIFLGAFHEAAHIVIALVVGIPWHDGILQDGLISFLIRTFIERQTVIFNVYGENWDAPLLIVRHSGWIVSVALALLIPKCYRSAKWAAAITAVEAITTDLLQWNSLLPVLAIAPSIGENLSVFRCGNVGIILLHHLWLTDQGQAALDILEKMVKVTMMRGAQSGGVITFIPQRAKKDEGGLSLQGIRSRVVNQKRTDLSVLVRRKVHHQVFRSSKNFPQDFVPVLSGHTRFATSSKATLEGTHPHRWTPPTARRVYDLSNQVDPSPQVRTVENYITHNGDFDFYVLNGKTYDIEVIQKWLAITTGAPMPASVDSCAVAGVVDLLRTQGCFGLSARYAVCFGLPTSKIEEYIPSFPSYSDFENIGNVFEEVICEMLKGSATSIERISETEVTRHSFALRVLSKLESPNYEQLVQPIKEYIDIEHGSSLLAFCTETIDAFFDNDLFMTTKTFLKNAKGSFGLCVTSSMDAHRQICLAARGQTMSVAFYPSKGIVCYGSEQAAIKAGMNVECPGVGAAVGSKYAVDHNAIRLDLDHVGGEILLLDWGGKNCGNAPVSKPNHQLVQHELMNGNICVILYQESQILTQDLVLSHRLTSLCNNRFIKSLPEESKDLILTDLQDIPRFCQSIQDDWHSFNAATSLNRLTAYNLSRCLRDRLESHAKGTARAHAIDILLTGCEVSLWVAEQFASDLQKSFPKLCIKAISSNKLLGLYGQEISVPAFGFPYSHATYSLHNSIVIIVSHSGGTFAPLACSQLLQSATKNIFVVTSEWDTQIANQLRIMDALDEQHEDHILHSRVFSTEVGIRPAEPCSLSVVATHQLLTNLFEYIAVIILSDRHFRRATGCVISEQDLQILEKCNKMNIDALEEIVGVSRCGDLLLNNYGTNFELRRTGNLWADHILENAKAYIMSFIYIFATVLSGFPFFYAVAHGAGLTTSNKCIYLVRLLDAAVYFWLPQINITILRLIQRRNLLHRMVGRTVVIGDIPWVAQAAEAFLSKIFACSYSIAGLNVLSGNPSDHLVHRHTHRVVRGSLVICGRPDGRLSALSTAEAAVCLSVNQASSIQSLGGTCESITIGHNPFKLPLTKKGIFLKRQRPLFLCERKLIESDAQEENDTRALIAPEPIATSPPSNIVRFVSYLFHLLKSVKENLDASRSCVHDNIDCSIRPQMTKNRSASALIGAFKNFDDCAQVVNSKRKYKDDAATVGEVIDLAIRERKWSDKARKLFQALDKDRSGFLHKDEFIKKSSSVVSLQKAKDIFASVDHDSSGKLDYDQFVSLCLSIDLDQWIKLPPSNRDDRGIIQIEASREKYFGEELRKYNAGKANKDVDFMMASSQHFSQELYESRIASLQRFVAMTVMFHQMGMRVQNFFAHISFGLLGYRIDRTHSIMRIATTASPISGSDVRQRTHHLQLLNKVNHSVHIIATAYFRYKAKKEFEGIAF